MTNSFLNYVNSIKVKELLLEQMVMAGYSGKISDEDMDKIVFILSEIGRRLKNIKDPQEQLDMLLTHILCLWAKLIVDHDEDIKL